MIGTLVRAVCLLLAALAPASGQEINPDKPPDPLNKVFFGARIYPERGPIRQMQTEVDTVQECLDHAAKALAENVGDAKAVEVWCIKERNAEHPS